MPQMAPIMWLPMFILIILLLLLSNKNYIKVNPKSSYFSSNWLW